MDMMRDVVNNTYNKMGGMKKNADELEQELETERKQAEHLKKVHVMCTNRIEFTKKKVFKRQNSYAPILDDFGDIDDADRVKHETARVRRSFKKDRKKLVTMVADCLLHRLDKDVFGGSEGDSGYKAAQAGKPKPGQPQPGQIGMNPINYGGGMVGNSMMMSGVGFPPMN